MKPVAGKIKMEFRQPACRRLRRVIVSTGFAAGALKTVSYLFQDRHWFVTRLP